jgi:hypothetical protein
MKDSCEDVTDSDKEYPPPLPHWALSMRLTTQLLASMLRSDTVRLGITDPCEYGYESLDIENMWKFWSC